MKQDKSNKTGLDIDFQNELLNNSTIHVNVKQEVIITTEDKIKIVLLETKEILTARRDWWTPFGLLISFVLTLSTADFKETFGLTKDTWSALFIISIIISIIWLIITLYKLYKYRNQSNLEKIIEKIKLKNPLIGDKEIINENLEVLKEININNSWNLNHWRSNCAHIDGNKMIFSGTKTNTDKADDGSHIDLKNILEIGKSYKISCFAESIKNTNAKFKLWCHDNAGSLSYGSDVSTDYKTPSEKGELIELIFKATHNKDIRIHFQYLPGEGTIVVSNLKIYSFSI